MIGLAFMAWQLANSRAFIPYARRFEPLRRAVVEAPDNAGLYPVSREYYRIIDRITRGEKP